MLPSILTHTKKAAQIDLSGNALKKTQHNRAMFWRRGLSVTEIEKIRRWGARQDWTSSEQLSDQPCIMFSAGNNLKMYCAYSPAAWRRNTLVDFFFSEKIAEQYFDSFPVTISLCNKFCCHFCNVPKNMCTQGLNWVPSKQRILWIIAIRFGDLLFFLFRHLIAGQKKTNPFNSNVSHFHFFFTHARAHIHMYKHKNKIKYKGTAITKSIDLFFKKHHSVQLLIGDTENGA